MRGETTYHYAETLAFPIMQEPCKKLSEYPLLCLNGAYILLRKGGLLFLATSKITKSE